MRISVDNRPREVPETVETVADLREAIGLNENYEVVRLVRSEDEEITEGVPRVGVERLGDPDDPVVVSEDDEFLTKHVETELIEEWGPSDEEDDADDEVRSARYDKRAAFLTFDALERQVIAAVRAEEFEVAAETAAALFLVQAELGEDWLDDYHSVSEEFEVEEEKIGAAMEAVYEWAVENDAGVREWFER